MRRDRGSAVVEFVGVVPLVFLVGLAVVQLALLAHAKGVVEAAAMEAARVAAIAHPDDRVARQAAQEVIADGLGGAPIEELSLSGGTVSGLPVVTVRIVVAPRLVLLPDVVRISATRQALAQGRA